MAQLQSSPDWHRGPKIQKAVNDFHDRYARQPIHAIEEAKGRLMPVLKVIENHLREKGMCSRIEPTGSSYQGTKIDDGNLEFDVDFEMDGHGLEALKVSPTHCTLAIPTHPPNQRDRLRGIFNKSIVIDPSISKEVISSTMFAQEFMSIIIKLKNTGALGSDITIRQHAKPALQMDVMRGGGVWFSVDLVPLCRVSGNSSFVAKPYKTLTKPDESDAAINDRAWSYASALEEKRMFDAMDQDSLCRKPAMRVLKAALSRQSELKRLTSYHIKTILLLNLREHPENTRQRWWPQNEMLGPRVMELLVRLKHALEQKNLEHYFLPGVNLFSKMTDIMQRNMYDRLNRLLSNENRMLEFLA